VAVLRLGALALLAATPLAAQQAHGALELTLGDAARLAARQSAAATAARYRAAAANARVTQSRADLLPSVSGTLFDGQHTFNSASLGINFPAQPGQPPFFDPNGQVIGPVRTPDLRLQASLTLFDLAAVQRLRAASSGAEAAEADAEDVAQQAAARAAVAYLVLLRAEALVGARTADSALAADLLDIARRQLAAGVTVSLDVTRAEAQLAESRADLIAARRDRDLARLDLLRRLDLPLDAAVQAADRLDGAVLTEPPPDRDSAVALALRSRPDVRAADAADRAARDRLAAARAEYLPSLSIFGDQGYTGKSYAHLLRTYEYGLRVSVPLFDGLRRRGRTGEQASLALEAQVRDHDVRQQAEADVRAALLDLASEREQVAAARERLRLAEQELAQARERFTTGVAGSTDVVIASASLNRARTRLVDALAGFQTARVTLARAQGAVTAVP
jgi:outer membrane protein TolC